MQEGHVSPGGKRLGDAAVSQRMEFVRALLAEGVGRGKIVDRCRSKFSMSPRTVDDYMRRVRDERRSVVRAMDSAEIVKVKEEIKQELLEALAPLLESQIKRIARANGLQEPGMDVLNEILERLRAER